MILHLECRAIAYDEGGQTAPSPPCGHAWAETLPMPMHSRAFVARMRGARLCPRCGTSDSVYLVEEGYVKGKMARPGRLADAQAATLQAAIERELYEALEPFAAFCAAVQKAEKGEKA